MRFGFVFLMTLTATFTLLGNLAFADFSDEILTVYLLKKRGYPTQSSKAITQKAEVLLADSELHSLIELDHAKIVKEFLSMNGKTVSSAADLGITSSAEKRLLEVLMTEMPSLKLQASSPSSFLELHRLASVMKTSVKHQLASSLDLEKLETLLKHQTPKMLREKPEVFEGEWLDTFLDYLGEEPFGEHISLEAWNHLYPFQSSNRLVYEVLRYYRRLWLHDITIFQTELTSILKNEKFSLDQHSPGAPQAETARDLDATRFIDAVSSLIPLYEFEKTKNIYEAINDLPTHLRVIARLNANGLAATDLIKTQNFYQNPDLHPEEGLNNPVNQDLRDWIVLQFELDQGISIPVSPEAFLFLEQVDPVTAKRLQAHFIESLANEIEFSSPHREWHATVLSELTQRIFQTDDIESQNRLIGLELSSLLNQNRYPELQKTILSIAPHHPFLKARDGFHRNGNHRDLAIYFNQISGAHLITTFLNDSRLFSKMKQIKWKTLYPDPILRQAVLQKTMSYLTIAIYQLPVRGNFILEMFEFYQSAIDELIHLPVPAPIMRDVMITFGTLYNQLVSEFHPNLAEALSDDEFTFFNRISSLHLRFTQSSESSLLRFGFAPEGLKKQIDSFRSTMFHPTFLPALACEFSMGSLN